MNHLKIQANTAIAFLFLISFSSIAISLDERKPKAVRDDILQFDVDGEINTLQIESYNGEITLVSGNDSSRVHGTAKTWAYGKNTEQAQNRLSKIAWEFSKSGKTLKLRLKGSGGGSNIKNLAVPEKWNLDLDTSNGMINIADGFANINAESNNGRINIEGGFQVIAETSNGRINYAGSPKAFKLESTNGKIEIQLNGNWKGKGKANSSNGNISVICTGIIDARLTSLTSNGKSFIYGPKLSKNSGTGSLSLATSNGNISITHPLNVNVF